MDLITLKAGVAGWMEVLFIAILLLWMYNSYRRSQLLMKMEEQVGKMNQKLSAPPTQPNKKIDTEKKGEYTDYEIVE
ncbi:MAG: hypothetical protein ACK4K0_08725 [Flavobacteriales bacterium]